MRLIKLVLGQKLISGLLRRFDWVALSAIGGSKFVKSFGPWLVVVPILSKMFNRLESDISLSLFSANFNLTFELPFNIFVFYLCSISFVIANVVYAGKCPGIIKDYFGVSDFMKRDGSCVQLRIWMLQLDSTKREKYKAKYGDRMDELNSTERVDFFVELVDDFRLTNREIRLILVLIYLIAASSIVFVFYENTVAVYRAGL